MTGDIVAELDDLLAMRVTAPLHPALQRARDEIVELRQERECLWALRIDARAEALEQAARCVDGNRYAFYTPEQHAAAIRALV